MLKAIGNAKASVDLVQHSARPHVELNCTVTGAGRDARSLRADARALMSILRLERFELSLTLTNDAAVQRLNRDFRGHDAATDVLSFPQLENVAAAEPQDGSAPGWMPDLLGDVVISIDTARRQAARLGIAPRLRLRRLLIHGVLHLLGYDHERSAAQARRMLARERELAESLRTPAGRRRRFPSRSARGGKPAE